MKYRHAFILFTLLYIIFFAPIIFRGEVIFPHNNDIEVGDQYAPDADFISNRKFRDESHIFIPEINFHLNGNHKFWLAAWNPDTELGRASILRALSKAYLPSHILSFFTTDPFLYYTILILATIFLTGLFMFLLLKSLNLRPLTCLIAASGMSFGVYPIYWLTFNVFLSSFCWTLGLMWLIRRFIQRPTLLLGLALSFFTYSLFMTAYPQSIVLNFYIITGFTLILLWENENTIKKKALIALMLGGTALFGAILTAPMFMDILYRAHRSARLGAGSDFLLRNSPKIFNFDAFLVYLNSFFNPFIFGNPIKEDYRFAFNGQSLTPLYSALFLLTFIKGLWRRLWPWHAFIALCFIGTLWPAAHIFAAKHMGFNLSATTFVSGAIIPAFILVAYAVDNLIYEDNGGAPIKKALVFLPLLPMTLLFIMFWSDMMRIIDAPYLFLSLAIIIIFYILTLISSKKIKTWGVFVLTLATIFIYSGNMRLIRPRNTIYTTSNIIKFIKEQTADKTRFAFVGSPQLIPANQESLFGLRSIQTYDSLSSREYQNLVKKLSIKGTNTYGRHFYNITDGSRLDRPEFSYTGIGLYISSMELTNPGLIRLGRWERLWFYKTINAPILAAQAADYKLKDKGAMLSGFLQEHTLLPARRLDNFTDYKTYSLTPASTPTLLFLSHQYHPRWQARSKSEKLQTLMVNDFYEGVIIPPDTAEVTLEFRPFSRWMWIPQIIFLLLGAALAVRYTISKKTAGSQEPASQGDYNE